MIFSESAFTDVMERRREIIRLIYEHEEAIKNLMTTKCRLDDEIVIMCNNIGRIR